MFVYLFAVNIIFSFKAEASDCIYAGTRLPGIGSEIQAYITTLKCNAFSTAYPQPKPGFLSYSQLYQHYPQRLFPTNTCFVGNFKAEI